MNSEKCNDGTRSRLYRMAGQLLMAQGDFNGAKIEYAKCIYFSSRFNGAESVETASGKC